jgi:DNA-binding NarL/FixJ family response regulator
MTMIRVLLADDHNLLRAGIRALLVTMPGIEVVGEAANGLEALGLVEARLPEVVLTDIAMPGLNGLELAARVTHRFPEIKVIILSMHADAQYVAQGLRAGASGYLLKDSCTAELELAIRAVAHGDSYLSPAVSKQVIADFVSRPEDDVESLRILTPRQREVLRLIAEGQTTKRIALALDISAKTVETHRAQLMERLDIHDVAGLVRYAIRNGLVKSDA